MRRAKAIYSRMALVTSDEFLTPLIYKGHDSPLAFFNTWKLVR